MRKILLAILILCPGWTALSQTAPTIITGTIVGAGGSNPSGTATITWQRSQNDANPRQTIAAGNRTITITNGVIPNVALTPNTIMLPAGTCYGIRLTLNGQNSQRYWTVPVSATPVDVGLVEGNIPCSNQPGPTIALGNIANSGASIGQVPVWNGAYWSPGAGGGGSGNPGGVSGQIQFNQTGRFGGFTLNGDCLISAIPTITCTKTNGVSFSPSAIIDTTNAGNINTGLLAPARGGTGVGQFSQGSIPFAGGSGVYQQDNANFFWQAANKQLCIGCNSPIDSLTKLQVASTGHTSIAFTAAPGNNFAVLGIRSGGGSGTNDNSSVQFYSGNTYLWTLAGTFNGDGLLSIRDTTFGSLVTLNPNGVFQVYNQGSSRISNFSVQAGTLQSSNDLFSIKQNNGTNMVRGDSLGDLITINAGFIGQDAGTNGNVAMIGNTAAPALNFASARGMAWSNTTLYSDTKDTGISKISPALIGIGNGTVGDFSGGLKLNNLTIAGLGGGGTLCLEVDNTGAVITIACASGGTVTHTSGPLLAGRLIVGNGSNDVNVLGSLGTTTTLLHGNAGGNPSFAAVSLTADVSGTLPFANGGTGLNTNFTNHFFFGNSSGGTAAPIAVQPTWADLAIGTALSVATFPGGDLFIGGVNAQSGTSYTVTTSDENKLATSNNGSAVAWTLPQATTTGFTSGAHFHFFNRGAGALTVTPTTSTINGSATLVLNQNQGAFLVSDGTNYSAWVSAAPSGSGTVTSIATTSPIGGGTITATGTITCTTCVTSAAALTSNNLIIGGGSQASAALGSLGTTTTVLHGNAGGAPSFGAVSLTADVTGVLPTANIAVALANQTSINGLGITGSTGTLTIANAKTLTASNTLTFTGTDGSTVAFGAGGTATYTSNNLSVFAATTSAQLAGVLSDETGTALAVFNTDPTLVGPTFTNEAEGTCNSGNRGKFTIVTGGAGVADTVRICAKDAANNYNWVPII